MHFVLSQEVLRKLTPRTCIGSGANREKKKEKKSIFFLLFVLISQIVEADQN